MGWGLLLSVLVLAVLVSNWLEMTGEPRNQIQRLYEELYKETR